MKVRKLGLNDPKENDEMLSILRKLAVEDEGQDLVEYGLLLVGIAVVVAAALPPVAAAIAATYPEVIAVL